MHNNEIWLNGNRYDSDSLTKPNSAAWKNLSDWERAIHSFLTEWFSDSEEVEMKTSGSTGVPQLIRLRKDTMRNSARATNRFFHLQKGDEVLLPLSADYIAGKMMLVRAIEGCLNLTAVAPCADPLAGMEKHFRFCAMVPMQVQTSLENGRFEELERIEHLIIGGSEVSPSLKEELQLLRTRCYATYGMTETASHVALFNLNGFGVVDVYKALPGITFSQDDRGCLVIHAPELSKESFVTNDVAELPDDTHFVWRGRFDNVINSGGVKLFPEMIEKKIAPFTNRRFFLGKENDDVLGERLVMVIEGEKLGADEESQLMEQISETVQRYEKPKRIIYLSEFLQTPTGKIRRIF